MAAEYGHICCRGPFRGRSEINSFFKTRLVASLFAAEEGRHVDVCFLITRDADLDATATDSGFRSVLAAAVAYGHKNAVSLLLENEVKINAHNGEAL